MNAMDEYSGMDARYWRFPVIPSHDVQERRRVPVARRLQGLRGMAWGVAAVFWTRKTAAWLSGLAQRDHTFWEGDGLSGRRRQRANSNIVHQYLHGERCPTQGPRGKWGFDLTGAVHALPGGDMARLYLESPLWELIEGSVSAERAKNILLLLDEDPPPIPMLAYVRAWAEYRLSTAEAQPASQQQMWRDRIGRLQWIMRSTDPVLDYMYRPLAYYLAACEPQIPLEQNWKPRLSKSMSAEESWAAFQRSLLPDTRFESGLDRYICSGRPPDRRFLQKFRQRWAAAMRCPARWEIPETNHADELSSVKGWEPLYKAWGIRRIVTSSDLKRRTVMHS